MYLISTVTIVLLVILALMIAALVVLTILGKKAQKKQEEQQEKIQAAKQPVTMLVIDKKRLRLTESGLPDAVVSTAPWYSKRAKLPIVKAKVGPQIMSFIADEEVFEIIPLKREVKAQVSGLYIVSVKGLHGKIEKPAEKKKKGIRAWAARFIKEHSKKPDEAPEKQKKKAKNAK